MKLCIFALCVSALVFGCIAVRAQDACHVSGGACTLTRYAQCYRRTSLLSVPGNSATPTATGVFLIKDTDVVLTAEGVVNMNGATNGDCNPDRFLGTPEYLCETSGCPLPNGPRGLLYRIGESPAPWQVAGSSVRVHDGSIKAQKQLYLIYNDDFWADNSGQYAVDIQVCDELPRSQPVGFAYTTAWNIVATPSNVTVSAQNEAPTYAGVKLDANTEVTVSATGLTTWAGPDCPECQSNAYRKVSGPFTCDTPCNLVQPSGDLGTLLYRLGTEGAWLPTGSSKVIRGTGQDKQELYFLVNDIPQWYFDNGGEYVVQIENLRERCPQNKCQQQTTTPPA